MAAAEPERARQELENLEAFKVVYNGDKVKAFVEWAREHAERLYPDVGMRSYVVPPLFVHKHSMRYNPTAGAEVLQDPQKSSPKGEKAHSLVTRSFSLLSPRLTQPLFVISGLEYDNMLKWVRHHPHLSPALPDDVENRGDIDIMLLHPAHGVVFIQVKAVGDNAESRTEAEVHKRIVLGGKQLRKDENILRWVLHDVPETPSCHVTRVVALPNLTHQELASFWPPADLDPSSEDAKNTKGVVFLCKDDLPLPRDPATPEADTEVTSLMTWWNKYVAGIDGKLSTSFMKDLVSRYVGMLSAVEVYTGNNLRKEVRVTSDAVDVCSMMFRRILLNEHQLHILSANCQRRYLSGPPGSGKTVLLVLRARQFVRQGGHVIIINMYRGAAGRAIGHFIRESVARFRVPLGKGKARSKGKKKKGEERQATEDTPQSAENAEEIQPSSERPNSASPSTERRLTTPSKDPHTTLQPRRRLDTPPSQSKSFDTSPRARKRLHTAPSLSRPVDPLPPARQRLDTAPSQSKAEKKKQASKKKQGRPEVSTKPEDTPTSPRKDQGTPPSSRKANGSPTANRKAQETEMDLSDRVHSVDVDIDRPSFNKEEFEAEIRHWLPDDVKPDDVMFVVDEIYVKEYWSDVLDVLNDGFPGCHIWCAGLYSRNPPGFEQADLLHVLRCPPLVQKVLHAVDWDERRMTRYRLNTDSSGVYTPGLTPLSVRHQSHPQVSITECTLCAGQLTSLLTKGLSLTPGASRESGSLLCSDVVILVNIPRPLYEPDARGFLDTTREDFNHYMAYLTTCPLITALRQAGLPVKVIEDLPCWSLYDLELKQDVVVAWCYAYQGLENKVVVYLPGDTPWLHDPHAREIPAPGLCSVPRDQPKVWEPTTLHNLMSVQGVKSGAFCEPATTSTTDGIVSGPHVNTTAAPPAPAAAAAARALSTCNVRCPRTDSAPDGVERELSTQTAPELKNPERTLSIPSVCPPQPGYELGLGEQGTLNQAVSGLNIGEGTTSCVCVNQNPEGSDQTPSNHRSPDYCSDSTTPAKTGNGPRSGFSGSESRSRSGIDLSDLWWREEDVRRYSNWDKSNLFVAASRCLSQLIMLVP